MYICRGILTSDMVSEGWQFHSATDCCDEKYGEKTQRADRQMCSE